MKIYGPRLRIRDSQIPSGNRVLAGHIMRYNVANQYNGWQSTQPQILHSVYTGASAYPSKRETTWDVINPGPPYVTGGPFGNIKVEFPHFDVKDVGQYPSGSVYLWTGETHRYDGGFCNPLWYPYLDEFGDSEYYELSQNTSNETLLPDLSSLGSEAYARLRPSVEKAGLAVALAEMRDVPRMLQSSSRTFADVWKVMGGNLKANPMAPVKAANTFLNVQFGWMPFLKDMGQMSDAYSNSITYLSQLTADNGKWVRRHRGDKRIEAEQVLWSSGNMGCQPLNVDSLYDIAPGPKSYTITLQTYTDVWYEGVFKYYRPEFDHQDPRFHSAMSAVKRRMSLYGANINPVVVWRATPWTWLADWFADIDDKIQLATDIGTDAAVSKYMYLMHRQSRRFKLNSKFTTRDGVLHDIVWYRNCIIKRRQSASSSFDFNLDGELSPRQLAILAALGISKHG